MEETRDHYVDWLRDAHAMEQQALSMLEGMSGRINNYPAVKTRIDQHIGETRGQIDDIAAILDRLGESPSMLKDTAGSITATIQSLAGMFASDEIVKGLVASYTFEQMEIGSYRILLAAADAAGDSAAVPVFNRILEQELAMADWLASNTDAIVHAYLTRTELDLTAKR